MTAAPLLVPRKPGPRIVWSGRLADEIPGLDGWTSTWPSLSHHLGSAAELVVLDSLSFPWDNLLEVHRQVPLVAWLPAGMDATEMSAVLGPPLLRHVSPFDRLVHHDRDVQQTLTRRWGIPEIVWLTPDSATTAGYLRALEELSRSRLVEVTGDVGTFRMERGDLITRHLQEHGAHQRGTLNVALDLVRPGDCVVDAGAHVGTFSVPLCRRVQPGGRTIAIEGDPLTAALLRENLAINGLAGPSTVLEAVLGRPGTELTRLGQQGNTGATHFVPRRAEGADSATATSIDALPELAGVRGPVSLIKLDLEGAELLALQGAETLVCRNRPSLVCEVSPSLLAQQGCTVQELDGWLAAMRYASYAITGPRNFRGEGWSVAPVPRLEDWPEEHFDIVAVPSDSAHRELLESGSAS
jgi:FkbM family methyltransferase